ncbi:unnamed protein product [Schistocephalus solidus]|uniref:Mediator of RNA polymerase II transcription subunit 7 n=1 Tax=Schistocephalus solidus TaxID=70667 RepID=A0A183STG4_SCHSO|nr:unnamed protein product [Schistocephalus solidus]
MAVKGVDPQLVVRGCRGLTTREVFVVPESKDTPDPQPVTSYFADVVLDKKLPPFTEAYKYRKAMKCIDPILEKLESCGRQRFCEVLRKLDAFADEIIN